MLLLWLLLVAIALALSGLALTGDLLWGDGYILRHLQHAPGGAQMEATADALHAVQPAVFAVALGVAMLRRRRWLVIAAVLVLLSLALNPALKEAIERALPVMLMHREPARGYGLPSGHAMSAILLYGYAAAVVSILWPRATAAAVALAAVVVLLIGFDRVYNAVHWPSDVFGGWAWGGLLLIASLAIARWLSRGRRFGRAPSAKEPG
jgi:membrane-associated phospholipid phosphatase